MRMARLAVALAGLLLMVSACRTPGPGTLTRLQEPPAGRESARAAGGGITRDRADGLVIETAAPVALPSSRIKVPAALEGKSWGLASVAVRWPALTPARSTQAIPRQARSLRLRVIGSDGRVRLSDFFFRGADDVVTRKTYALPVETGLLLEVRAYLETRGELETTPASGQTAVYLADAVPGFVEPPFNDGQVGGQREFNMVGRRVLAEGVTFNFQVQLFADSAVSIRLDDSQLVAGIGGEPSYGLGGDPYFPNFVSTARFAPLANPRNLYLDTWNSRRRLLFTVNPQFEVEDPKIRHLVMMLTSPGIEGRQSDAEATGSQVLRHVAGGSKLLSIDEALTALPLRTLPLGAVRLATLFGVPTNATVVPHLYFDSVAGETRRFLGVPVGGAETMKNNIVRSDLVDFAVTGLEREMVAMSGFAAASSGVGSGVGKGLLLAKSRELYEIEGGDQPRLRAGGAAAANATPSASVTSRALDIILRDNIVGVAGMVEDEESYALASSTLLLHGIGPDVRLALGSEDVSNPTLATVPEGLGTNPADVRATDLRDVVASPASASVVYVAGGEDGVLLRMVLPANHNYAVTAPTLEVHRVSGYVPVSLSVSSDGTRLAVVDSTGGLRVLSVGANPSDSSSWTEVAVPTLTNVVRACFVPRTGGDLLVAFTVDERRGQMQAIEPSGGDGSSLLDGYSSYDLRLGDGRSLSFLRFGFFLADSGFIDQPGALSVLASGDVVVADTGNSRVRYVRMQGDDPDRLDSLVTSDPERNPLPLFVLDRVEGLDTDAHSTVFVADSENYCIRIWRPSCGFRLTGLQVVAGEGQRGYNWDNINARLVQLGKVTSVKVERSISGRRRVFFIDGGQRVRMLTPRYPDLMTPLVDCGPDPYFDYIVSTIAGGGQGTSEKNAAQFRLTSPSWLDVDQRGYVYVADGRDIRRIDPDAGTIVSIFTASANITSFVIDDSDARLRELYFTTEENQTIRKLILED